MRVENAPEKYQMAKIAAKPKASVKAKVIKTTPVAKAVAKGVNKKNAQDGFTALSAIEGLRKNAGMYLGEPGEDMAYRSVKEVVDNAYDEAVAGRNKLIEVVYNEDKDIYIVADGAGGIPTTVKKVYDGTTEAIMTSAFTRVHAGGKFDNDAYKTSAGTHGVGVTAVNAVSERIRVWSNFEKKTKGMEYSKGECVTPIKNWEVDSDVAKALQDPAKKYGTVVAWSLDQTVVSVDAKRGKKLPKGYVHAKLNVERTRDWLQSMSDLNPGLEIRFTHILNKKGKRTVFLNKKTMGDVIKRIADERELTLDGKPFELKTDYVSLAISWADHPDTDLFTTFVNTSPTIDHGWHVTGFRNALEAALKPFLPAKKGSKGKTFTASDLLVGAIGMFDWRMHGAQYTSQVKDKLASRVEKEVQEIIEKPLTDFFAKNKSFAKKIIKRAELLMKGRDELSAVIKSMADTKKKVAGNSLPPFLEAAPRCKPHERELVVVEGDSAGGTGKNARDPEYQEIMKAGGKPLNGLKAALAKVLTHKQVQGLLISIGADLKTLDPKAENPILSTEKLRVGNVLFLMDADPDGSHIVTLFLAVIYRLLPDLMREGRVWVVDSPLYNVMHKGKHYGGMTFEECRAKAPAAVKNSEITRAKGWGEVSPDVLRAIAFDPSTRRLIRINPFENVEQERFFRGVVAEDAVYRRRLLGLEEVNGEAEE